MDRRNVDYVDLPVYRDQLGQALHFTPADLEANRAGHLGPNQASYQSGAIARATAISVGLAVTAVACVAAAVAVGVTTLVAIGALVIALCCAAWIGINVRYLVPVWRDVNMGLVSSVEGFVKAGEHETDVATGSLTSVPIWSYYWTVDDRQRFWVPGRVYASLTPARHRLYFLPSSRRIVAAVPVAEA